MKPIVDILLVEDDPHDLELALHAFERHRLTNEIHVARDGAEALEFLFGGNGRPALEAAEQPTLVLLDLKLPKVSGLDVLREIRARPASRLTPVVVLTASNQERDVIDAYELGANAYIVKPIDFERFVECARVVGLFWTLLNVVPRNVRS